MHPRRDQLTEAEAARAADVFTTHQRFIENVVRRHAPTPDHVPDIVQAVAVKICRGLNGFRNESQLTTWLFRVAVNESRTCYRGERRFRRAIEAMETTPEPEPVLDPDDQVAEIERREALHEAINDLQNPLHRNLMRNHLTDGLVVTGSKTSRHRARRRLRELLADDPRLES
jgi:RNA polymerase sigma factor (sigma-70 family)